MPFAYLMLHAAVLTLSATTIPAVSQPVERIAFGSCLRQTESQPVWDAILAARPDLFLFAGDNVYADTDDPATMKTAYQLLADQPGYQRLRTACPVHATWDDHDYGRNDAGAEYPMRAESERIFLDFFRIPDDAPERLRPGVYAAHSYGPPGRRTQVMLLDTRSFRGPLKRAAPSASCPKAHYVANPDAATTLLGAAQWTWLEQQLRQPADLRIIVSSIQVIPDQHCFEKWGNLPHERERLFELIGASAATRIVLVSGDRHLAEISRLDHPAIGYPLYEVTASGMNSAGAGLGEVNGFRVTKDNFRGDNFGLIVVDWSQPDPTLRLQVLDTDGTPRIEQSLRLGQLRPAH